MNIKEIAQELYNNIKFGIENKNSLAKQKNLTMADYTSAGYGLREAEKLLESLDFIDFTSLQTELDLIKEEEIKRLAPIKSVNVRKFNKYLKEINNICFEALILTANIIHNKIVSAK